MGRDYRLGVDIGGTFTDFTLINAETGEHRIEKLLTTPNEPEAAIFAGISALERSESGFLGQVHDVVHATTLVTNTVLERRGARTGLITTEGFRDILEIRRESRYDLYDMFIRFPEPLVPRRHRIGVPERVLADGTVVSPLDETSLRAAVERLAGDGIEAIAVCFLHAYRFPEHELRAAEIIAEMMPGMPVSLSHRVLPEPKEYERCSTTTLDAYVKAMTEGYLDRLQSGLKERGCSGRLFIMLSNGGSATVDTAKTNPVLILESGPAAGVEAAAFYGQRLGLKDVLAFDMGGTTAKLCIVENGRATRTRMFEVDRVSRFKVGSGLPVAIPVYELIEIGAGGGSMAAVNDLGLLQVGPQSAGADPGPACYGRGGRRPTVTDADLLLGLLNPDYFLGGDITLDVEVARRAMDAEVAGPAGLTVDQAAVGIHDLVNELMASAARVHVADKGKAPSALTLIASGGAGPVHVTGLARKLGCPRVVIPPYPGVLSSLGLLSAPIAFERGRAVNSALADIDMAKIESQLNELENETAALLPDDADTVYDHIFEMRYSGQDYALEIALPTACSDPEVKTALESAFLATYEGLYGKVDDDNPVEVAHIRVKASQSPPAPSIALAHERPAARAKEHRRAWVGEGGFVETPVYERSDLGFGHTIDGPAIIEERESTTIVGAGDRATVDEFGCLIIEVALPDHAADDDQAYAPLATVER